MVDRVQFIGRVKKEIRHFHTSCNRTCLNVIHSLGEVEGSNIVA